MAPVTTSGTAVGRVLVESVMVALAASAESRSRRPLQRWQSKVSSLRSPFPRRLSSVSAPSSLARLSARGGGGATYHARCLRRCALLMFWWLSLAETVKARAAARRSETARIFGGGAEER
jgi:hypothetical protein